MITLNETMLVDVANGFHSLDNSVVDGSGVEGSIRDGIVNLERWSQLPKRVLHLGKEAYDNGDGTGGGWDMTELMNKDPEQFIKNTQATWSPVVYIAWAIKNGYLDWDDTPYYYDNPAVADSLLDIAIVNCGKMPGSKMSDMGSVSHYFSQNIELIVKQVQAYQPNIVIGWNTLTMAFSNTDFLSKMGLSSFQQTDWVRETDSTWYFKNDEILFINAYHPAQLKIGKAEYVNQITNMIQKFFPV
jgi:hypothetical protein